MAALALGAPLAGADTTWTKVSTDYNANIVVPSLGLTGTTAVVAWTQETSPSTSDLNAVSFTTSPTQDVIGAVKLPVLTGWAQIDYTHALFPAPGGGLQLIFNGIHSTTTGDPLNGMATTLRNADGSWAAPFAVSGSSSGPTTGVLSGATPLVAGYATQGIEIFNAAVGPRAGCVRPESAAPARRLLRLLAAHGARQRRPSLDRLVLERDGGHGRCTCSSSTRRRARPSARPRWRPTARAATTTASGRTSRARRPVALVYGNSPAAGARQHDRLLVARAGARHDRQPRRDRRRAPAASLATAYRADGRLWVAWFDGKTYRATLGDATGAGGEVQDAGVPKGSPRAAPTR